MWGNKNNKQKYKKLNTDEKDQVHSKIEAMFTKFENYNREVLLIVCNKDEYCMPSSKYQRLCKL